LIFIQYPTPALPFAGEGAERAILTLPIDISKREIPSAFEFKILRAIQKAC
jgi:hypothetical protein